VRADAEITDAIRKSLRGKDEKKLILGEGARALEHLFERDFRDEYSVFVCDNGGSSPFFLAPTIPFMPVVACRRFHGSDDGSNCLTRSKDGITESSEL